MGSIKLYYVNIKRFLLITVWNKISSIGFMRESVCVCVHPTTSYLFSLNTKPQRPPSKTPFKHSIHMYELYKTHMQANTILGSHRVDAVTRTHCARGLHVVRLFFVLPYNTQVRRNAQMSWNWEKMVLCGWLYAWVQAHT